MSVERISIKRFREAVDSIKDKRDSTLIKVAYLLAARNSEILTKTSACELLSNASKPYGNFMTIRFEKCQYLRATSERAAVTMNALVISMAVAKRGKRIRKLKEGEEETTLELQKHEVIEALKKFKQKKLLRKYEQGELQIDPMLVKVLLGKVAMKVVALPVHMECEPWIKDLLAWIKFTKRMSLTFNITRGWFRHIVRSNLASILPKVHKNGKNSLKNILRHYRIAHLIEYYQFNPYEVTSYVGWSISSTSGQMGIPISANLDHYAHLRWKAYFPKLCKPIDTLMN